MANLMDYMVWRGEFAFNLSPWNPADALAMANLCYLNFDSISDDRGWTLAEAKRLELVRPTEVAGFEDRKAQYEAMADTIRFGGIRMHHFINLTDVEQELQFSATCYDMPDGALCIGFRGTDGTLVGWREDFNMSWQSTVPAQQAAVFYLEKASEVDDRRSASWGTAREAIWAFTPPPAPARRFRRGSQRSIPLTAPGWIRKSIRARDISGLRERSVPSCRKPALWAC